MHWKREAFRECEGHSCVRVRLKVSESWGLTFSAHPPSSHGSLCQKLSRLCWTLLRISCLVRCVRPASLTIQVLLSGQSSSPIWSCGHHLCLPPCQQAGCVSKCLAGKTTRASMQIGTVWVCPPAPCCVSSHSRNSLLMAMRGEALGLLGQTLLLFPCSAEQEVKVRQGEGSDLE